MSSRKGYRVLSLWGDVKAATRGPGPLARREVRKRANRVFNRWLRRVLRP